MRILLANTGKKNQKQGIKGQVPKGAALNLLHEITVEQLCTEYGRQPCKKLLDTIIKMVQAGLMWS